MSRLFQKPEIKNTLEHFIENTVIEHVKEPLPKTQGLSYKINKSKSHMSYIQTLHKNKTKIVAQQH